MGSEVARRLGLDRRCWAEVDLAAISHNARVLKAAAGPGRLLMSCVKGDGYGHGMIPAARAVLAGGADRLSVAQVEEGVTLREAGIKAPIQVLIEPLPHYAPAIARYDLIPSLSSPEIATELAARLREGGWGRIKVHVEVDTGMGRVTLAPEEAPGFLDYLETLRVFEVEGLFSHFSSSHVRGDRRFREVTLGQIALFQEIVAACQRGGRRIELKHLASSGGVALYPESYLDLIRPGALNYGYRYDWSDLDLRPAMTLKALVWTVRTAKAGVPVGYDQSWTPEKDTVLAVISAGFADGYPRISSNRAHLIIRGRRARVVGLVGMDQLMADVGSIPGVARGDEAILLGRSQGETVAAVELAGLAKTTAVALTTNIAARVERIYLNRTAAVLD